MSKTHTEYLAFKASATPIFTEPKKKRFSNKNIKFYLIGNNNNI